MKILMIDDNEDISTAFSKYFIHLGHECSVSNNGQNALSMIENNSFDVILMDIAMPEFSGSDIVESLYSRNLISDKLIVALTASSISDEEKDLLKKRGVHSILKKPIDPDDLLDYVSKIKKQMHIHE
ncbi:MAG: response regulator [Candidatus Nitrosopumilus sp. bin_7KS]